MFDIGWQELFIIAVIGLVVIGPKDLPRALRAVAKWVRKARSLAREFQSGVDDMVREAELDDLKKEMETSVDYDITKEIENSIDPTGDMTSDLGMDDIEKDLDDAGRADTSPPSATDDVTAEETPAEPVPAEPPADERAGKVDSAPDAPPVEEDTPAQAPAKASG